MLKVRHSQLLAIDLGSPANKYMNKCEKNKLVRRQDVRGKSMPLRDTKRIKVMLSTHFLFKLEVSSPGIISLSKPPSNFYIIDVAFPEIQHIEMLYPFRMLSQIVLGLVCKNTVQCGEFMVIDSLWE